MQYNVWVHSFLTDDVIELPGTVVEAGEVTKRHLYGEVQRFVFETDNDEAFMLACERLDAVAAYEQVAA